jgi:hypothetical protein
MPKPKPKAKPESQSKTEPQKRGEVFDTLLTFFRKPKRKTLILELPRALKSYPYIAMKRAGVTAKAEYETIAKAANPLDDVLRFKVTLETHDKTPKQKTGGKSKSEKKPKKGSSKKDDTGDRKFGLTPQPFRRSKTPANVVPITPTKGVDITQAAIANA